MPTEQELTKADAPEQPEVRYVLSGQPTERWAAAKGARVFDVKKVQRYKDDIDILIVSAGFSSAVLSVFLIAAYPQTQQAPSDRILFTIGQAVVHIARYSLNLTDDMLIADHMPTLSESLLPFQASDDVDDARENVLWFASLIISLITAFLGLLVKQWLYEHLATEDLVTLHRTRLRRSRAPQMEAWVIFTIAELLPILLTVSLGLFIIGLCYFTSSAHA